MRILDILHLAFKTILNYKIRTALLILSIVVGVAAIIALTAQTEGVGKSVISYFQSLGPDTILVNIMGRGLTQVDIAVISSLENVKKVIPIIRETASVNLGAGSLNTVVYGIASDNLKDVLGDLKLVDGFPYSDSSIPSAIIGYQIATSNTTGEQLIFPGQILTLGIRGGSSPMAPAQASSSIITVIVAGILDKYGVAGVISPDSSIFIPLQAAEQIFNRRWYNMLIIKVSDVNSIDSVIESLRNMYGASVNAISPTQITQTMQNIVQQLSILLGGIAAVSLIAAALGIFNMMLVTVIERTKEIGTMKALGFKNKHILTQIIFEGLLIGVSGGVIGILLGVVIAYMLPNIITNKFIGMPTPGIGGIGRTTQIMFRTVSYSPSINPSILLISFTLAVIVSILSSIYPAWRAAKMDPVKALRYE